MVLFFIIVIAKILKPNTDNAIIFDTTSLEQYNMSTYHEIVGSLSHQI